MTGLSFEVASWLRWMRVVTGGCLCKSVSVCEGMGVAG